MGQIFKCVYLLSFYSFLRMSNLVPHSISDFSPLKHLARGDVIFKSNKVILLLKWSKTMQSNNEIKLIHVPRIPRSSVCPDTKVRRHFHLILSRLGLAASGFTFHSFRRSGATFAFNNNVALQNIQRHGTWTSDCVWRY